MKWLKHITIDLIATLVIAIVVFFEAILLEYVLYIYTVLMVIARSISLFSRDIRTITKKKMEDAPRWVYHLLYFLNVAFLVYGFFLITAAAWVYIWGVAYYVDTQNKP